MSDGFERMVKEARIFFAELDQNNSKAWFDPQKARYKEQIAGPAGFFSELLAEDIGRITGKPHKPKVFRIYRDVRFSKDKTPLNTHLHIMWQPLAQDAAAPTWFWGLGLDYFIMGMGIMNLQGENLTRYRAFIDNSGVELSDALDRARRSVGANISDWGPEPLKRVPKPYDPDHPPGDLLRRKALAISAELPTDWQDTGVLKSTLNRIEGMMPVWNLFDQHLQW